MNQITTKPKRIAIIGAGPSGLSMAFALRERGHRDVVVYERGSEVGGKVLSVADEEDADAERRRASGGRSGKWKVQIRGQVQEQGRARTREGRTNTNG